METFIAWYMFIATAALGQVETPREGGAPVSEKEQVDEAPPTPLPREWSLDVGYDAKGISFGNSWDWDGLRFNFRDAGVTEVNGLNFTLWRPGENPDFEMNGLAIGIFGPGVSRLRGVALGVGAVVGTRELEGVSLAGIATVSQGATRGLQMGGIAAVSSSTMEGLNIGGIATVAQGGLRGASLSGLATVSQGRVQGVSIGGLAVVGQGRITGLGLGGLALVSQGDMRGINLAGLASVSQGRMQGVNVSGLATVGQGETTGVNIGGLAVVSNGWMTGVQIGGLHVGSGKSTFWRFWFTGDLDDDVGAAKIRGLSVAGWRTQAFETEALAREERPSACSITPKSLMASRSAHSITSRRIHGLSNCCQ
jgi:hypothetical protein